MHNAASEQRTPRTTTESVVSNLSHYIIFKKRFSGKIGLREIWENFSNSGVADHRRRLFYAKHLF